MTEKNKPEETPGKGEEQAMAELRKEIDVSAVIGALELHVLGDLKMTGTQVSAALALLRKTLPDLLSVPVVKILEKRPKAEGTHEEALEQLE